MIPQMIWDGASIRQLASLLLQQDLQLFEQQLGCQSLLHHEVAIAGLPDAGSNTHTLLMPCKHMQGMSITLLL